MKDELCELLKDRRMKDRAPLPTYMHPMLALKRHEWETECAARGLEVVVTCFRRVADGGWREHGLAFHFLPLVDGKFPLDDKDEQVRLLVEAAAVAEDLGLSWGAADGDATELRLTFGLTLRQLAAGRAVPDALPPRAEPSTTAKGRRSPAAQAGRQKTQRSGKSLRQR